MKVGYGYKRHEKDLRAIGAEKVYIDITPQRTERNDMLAYALREGDELLLLSMRDLGGSAKADAIQKAGIEGMGVTIKVVALPNDAPPKKIGRPKKFDPTPEQREQIRKIWLCWHYTEAYKLRRVAEIMGFDVGRGLLFNEFGSMKKPKEGQSGE